MTRNIFKQAEQGEKFLRKHEQLELSADELYQFFKAYNDTEKEDGTYGAIWNTICLAFKMGVAVGRRNA